MISLAAILHRIDPFAIQISRDVGIRWYGLSYLAGFALAYLIIWWFAKRRRAQLAPNHVGDFVVAVAIGTVIGGRLGYCLFYQPELLLSWRVVALWDGGMASHGGIIGIIIASIIFARRNNVSALHLLDLTVLGGTLGVFFGRIANFVNGELYGRVCEPAAKWAVRFPQELDTQMQQPQVILITQRVRELIAEGVLQPVGDAYQNLLHGVQTNDEIANLVTALPLEILPARYPSQIYQGLLEGLAVFMILAIIWWWARKPGIISGWFLVLYAVMRIIGEQFREPDAHLKNAEFAMIGITRGQLLSIGMLALGLGCLIYWSLRKVDRISGWGPKGIACALQRSQVLSKS